MRGDRQQALLRLFACTVADVHSVLWSCLWSFELKPSAATADPGK
eukprot:IDg3790t1